MIINYEQYIKSKKITPTFNKHFISYSENIIILKYEKGK